ncbi:D-3-phosphoglycerate dehydrogenase [Porphyridium purpureum]|uniref:phosphoglycerate dehydrogenase n=1 Tax=Porphyridium purpureum TaxID=35688 RepID=A0A5J4YQ38_PORPP|nr:D-3-phosphoglycerate dehydrogenase [Porphyridium purpureum]|eukprot:POR1362..scf222_8
MASLSQTPPGVMFGMSPLMTARSGDDAYGSLSRHSFEGLSLTQAATQIKLTFPKDKINFLLLENVSPSAVEFMVKDGFNVETVPRALTEDELLERIDNVSVLGIRSKTRVTQKVLEKAQRLLAVGCFCIGTDQVDLAFAEKKGIAVFNAPFANTRSVAELVLCEIIALNRRLTDRSSEMHSGVWNKVAAGCYEVRGKTLGIVGYGHIGTQLSIMAEMMGMKVVFYDLVPKLPLGNSEPRSTLEELLQESDVVSLHVPRSDLTKNMIAKEQLALMKKGALLINAARGTVVKLEDLAEYLKSGHLGGAAVDVFPTEPEKNGPGFESVLIGCPNTILTPHVAGSTQEAQSKIGEEVAVALLKFVNMGCTMGSVNLPNLELPVSSKVHRILNLHKNVPGVLRDINNILANLDCNVNAQMLGTTSEVGYLIIDVDKATSAETKKAIAALPASIRTRLLY